MEMAVGIRHWVSWGLSVPAVVSFRTQSGGYGQPQQPGRIGLVRDAPNRSDQAGSIDEGGAVGSQLAHLGVEFGVAHRPAGRAATVPDMLAVRGSVGKMQYHGRRLDRDGRVLLKDDP